MQANGGSRNTFAGDSWAQNSQTVIGNIEGGLNMNRSNPSVSTQGSPYGDISITQFP